MEYCKIIPKMFQFKETEYKMKILLQCFRTNKEVKLFDLTTS